jgi:hypothetical protein
MTSIVPGIVLYMQLLEWEAPVTLFTMMHPPPYSQVFKSIPYCIQLAGGPYIETHKAVVDAFRPPQDKRKPKEQQ